MKRNWIIVALFAVFIVIYQIKVLNPYNAAHRPVIQSVKNAPPSAHPGGTTSTASTAPTQASGNFSAIGTLSKEDEAQAVSVPMGQDRSFKVFPDLSIGSAVFGDYFVRGHGEKLPVSLLPNSLRWNSTDPAVQTCLNGLKQGALSGASLVREFRTPSGSCRAQIEVDPGKQGLIHFRISLSGFAASKGFLEFKGSDTIGDGPAQDHNYLGYRVADSIKFIKEKSLKESSVKEGKLDWLAWGDKYFITALLPTGTYNPNVIYGAADADKNSPIVFGVQYPLQYRPDASASAPSNYDLNVYFGTREAEQLRAIDPKFAGAVDLGMFGAIARLLIWALKRLNLIFNNFGLSIIALTILVRAAFWPLNKKVYVSGLKMKSLQPQIDRLKAKYGTDKSKADQMNRELMGLYKTNKVNPVGSCLPMLLQLPIFVGLYSALGHSLDLYQAPFFGWIHDLSWHDPYYVFPAAWTISLLGYMKLNPQGMQTQPGQPDMKWIMMGMNVFFGYLSRDWPSGLTLYLFVSNLVGIIQQVMLRRDSKLQPIQEGV